MVPVLFDLTLHHGRCVGITLPPPGAALEALAAASLLPEELATAATMGLVRGRDWVGGRVALREALSRLGKTAPPILADARGAPQLPPGLTGSISHKETLAVALLAEEAGGARVGVDVERDVVRGLDISAKVLRAEELAELSAMSAEDRARAVLLRFSAKEAVYKALHPFVKRYVGFQEVALRLEEDGTGEARAYLTGGEGSFTIEVRWMRREGWVVTTARVQRDE